MLQVNTEGKRYRKNIVPDISAESILRCCLNKNIISLDDVMQSSPENLIEAIVRRIHSYAIFQTHGKYYTYIKDQEDFSYLRGVRKTKKEDLYKFLLFHYGIIAFSAEIQTFSDLFEKWLEYKKRYIGAANSKKGLSASTIRRYERDFEKHFKGSVLAEKRIISITPINIEEYMVELITNGHLSENCASNLFSILRQCFDYAVRSGLLRNSPMDTVDRRLVLSVCESTPVYKDCDRILSRTEMRSLVEEIWRHEKEHPDYMPDYAIELAILTGMRVGELAALKWSCIDETAIHIDFSEHRLDYKNAPSEIVIGEPKNRKHRWIPLTMEIKSLLERIHNNSPCNKGEYVFVDHLHNRCTERSIGCAVRKRGAAIGIKNCSIHRIRRTVSSILNQSLPQKVVADLLGHSEFVNEMNYHYSTADMDEKRNALDRMTEVWK